MSVHPDGMTRFERGVVFRVARGFFFVMALLAVLVFVAGVFFGVRSLTKIDVPEPSPVAPPQPPVPLGYQDIARFKKAMVDAQTEVGGTVAANPKTPAAKPGGPTPQEQVKALAEKLRALFPDPPYSWDNVVEKYCADPTAFGCLRTDVRVKRKGVVAIINAALDKVPEDQVIHLLEVLVAVLTATPVEERGEMVAVIVELERGRLKEFEEATRRYEADLAAQKLTREGAIAAEEALRVTWRGIALGAVGAGFAALIILSLFLAFLAMERHLRALDELLRRSRGQA